MVGNLLGTTNPTPQANTNNNAAQDFAKLVNELNKYSQASSNIANQSALQTAASAYFGAATESQGILSQNNINDYANRANVALDLENLALNINYGLLAKQNEMVTMDLQMFEKYFGNVMTIFQTTTDNTITRMKQVVQNFKY